MSTARAAYQMAYYRSKKKQFHFKTLKYQLHKAALQIEDGLKTMAHLHKSLPDAILWDHLDEIQSLQNTSETVTTELSERLQRCGNE